MGRDSEGRAEPVQIKLRPKGVGIGFSDNDDEEVEVAVLREKSEDYHKMGWNFNVKDEDKETESREKRKHPIESYQRPTERSFEIYEHGQEKEKVDKFEIIDYTNNTSMSMSPPLSDLLRVIASKKKGAKALLVQKQFELDASLRELNRNIEEVRKERENLVQIERENEVKRELNEFISKHGANETELVEICADIKTLTLSQSDWRDKVICSVLIQKQKEYVSNPEMMEMVRNSVSPELYSQIIYHLWWPNVKREDLTVSSLKGWVHLLPDDFLVLFLGNQVLLPRLHYILRSETEDVRQVLDLWEFLVNILGKEGGAFSVLIGEIVAWWNQRIMAVQPKSFKKLLEEFQKDWLDKKLLNSEGISKLKGTWKQRVQRLIQRDLVIDPADQDLLPLECALLSCSSKILTNHSLSLILTEHLIPKLKRTVQNWLQSPQVDYDEVAEWYVAWKEIVPLDLREGEGEGEGELMEGFAQILNVINENI